MKILPAVFRSVLKFVLSPFLGGLSAGLLFFKWKYVRFSLRMTIFVMYPLIIGAGALTMLGVVPSDNYFVILGRRVCTWEDWPVIFQACIFLTPISMALLILARYGVDEVRFNLRPTITRKMSACQSDGICQHFFNKETVSKQ